MAIRNAAILLLCTTGCILAQYQDVDSPASPKPQNLVRRFKPHTVRLNPSSQSLFTTAKYKRPIPLGKARPISLADSVNSEGISPVFSSQVRGNLKPATTTTTTTPAPPPIDSEEQNDEPIGTPIYSSPIHHHHHHHPVKPVSEDDDKDENIVHVVSGLGSIPNFSPSINLVTPPPQPPPQPIVQFRPPQISRQSQPIFVPPETNFVPVQYRPQKPSRPIQRPERIIDRDREYDIPESRPAPPPPSKQRPQAPPKKTKSDYYSEGRPKKPVAQVIRRYREETEDGSIMWGFENDDGSFKEEIIGIDCITRGKYGYVDPDGLKREYTYETGIKCDEEPEQEDILNTFVDYQENKLVLPSGKTIDLSNMGKKQARRLPSYYRN